MNYFQYNCKYKELIPIQSYEITWTTNTFISYYQKGEDNKLIRMANPTEEQTKEDRIKTIENIIEEYEARIIDYKEEISEINEKLIYYKQLLQQLKGTN
jgi:hypothetical protein